MALQPNKEVRYEKFKKKCHDKCSVWHYFLRAENGQSAKCELCSKIIKCHGGSTTGLRVHLKSAHVIDINEVGHTDTENESIEPSTSQTAPPTSSNVRESSCIPSLTGKKRKITDFFHSNQSMEATLSRMTALDGLPFSVFCTSEDQRRLLLNSGYNKLPKTPRGIKDIVMNYAKKEKEKLMVEIKQLLNSDRKFSLTFDEWTSSRNARYININLHSGNMEAFADGSKFKNLGLVRIHGSMPAEICIHLLEMKLSELGLSLNEDIVAITTDGASVMLKVGRQLSAFHQVCLAHGIQLAVLDVLYKKGNAVEIEETQNQTTDGRHSEDLNTNDNDEGHSSDDDVGGIEVIPLESNSCSLNSNYKSVIEKVRAVVKIFKNSPVKNDTFLQKHVKQDMGKNIQLLADCKTRWGSIATMLERFNRLKSCISKALIDMKSDIKFTESEHEMLESIHKSLHIIKLTVEALCRRDATLLTADAAMKFMLRKLDSQGTTLAQLFARSLRERISQRRLVVASLLQYLHNSETYFKEVATAEFLKLSNPMMVEHIHSLLQRLHNYSETVVNDTDVSNTSKSSDADVDFEIELNKEIEKSLKEKETSTCSRNERDDFVGEDGGEIDMNDKRKLIRIEMALFENGGNRGLHLDKVYKYLMTIPPTSVESERAFSSAAYTCNKIRSSLKDNTLDSLCFLRSFFQQARSHQEPSSSTSNS